jgi:pyruvate/2-oxoglutarate/acetoin dehydrogenase E1 component
MSTIHSALTEINATADALGYWLHHTGALPVSLRSLLGQPGLTLLALHTLMAPADLFRAAEADSNPALILNDARLQPCELLLEGQGDLLNWTVTRSGERYPTLTLHPEYSPALTLATYGYNFELARAAALDLLMTREIFCEIVLFTQLSPVEFAPLEKSIAVTRRLVTVETDSTDFGWGAELIARAAVLNIRRFKVHRVAVPAHTSADHLPFVESILTLLKQKNR